MVRNARPAGNKVERLNIRVTADEKAMVEQAAALSHTSTSGFMLQAALRSAEAALAEETIVYLPEAEWDRFLARLEEPARELPGLKRAIDKVRQSGAD
jgi:uncharacterized protein (DUF1778 family)